MANTTPPKSNAKPTPKPAAKPAPKNAKKTAKPEASKTGPAQDEAHQPETNEQERFYWHLIVFSLYEGSAVYRFDSVEELVAKFRSDSRQWRHAFPFYGRRGKILQDPHSRDIKWLQFEGSSEPPLPLFANEFSASAMLESSDLLMQDELLDGTGFQGAGGPPEEAAAGLPDEAAEGSRNNAAGGPPQQTIEEVAAAMEAAGLGVGDLGLGPPPADMHIPAY